MARPSVMTMELRVGLTKAQQEQIVETIQAKLGKNRSLISWEIVNPYLIKIKYLDKE